MRSLATCGEHDKLVPYLRVQYCAFGGGVSLTNVFRVAVALACVAILFVSSRRFFLPALENLARACWLSDDAAGATLLALANAAPWLVAKWINVAERCARDGCVGGFLDDPRRGDGFRENADEALRGAAILTALVFPVCVLATPHGMGGRVRRNEDDERDDEHEQNRPGVFVEGSETTNERLDGEGPRQKRSGTEYAPVLVSGRSWTRPRTGPRTKRQRHARYVILLLLLPRKVLLLGIRQWRPRRGGRG